MKYEYFIVFASDAMKLIEVVNSYLEKGWKCQGGVSVCIHDDGVWYYQAVIREGNDD